MSFKLNPLNECSKCVHGYCVSYIREQSKRMKDRDTLYRLSQKKSMACTYDQGVPGFSPLSLGFESISELANLCIQNGEIAGKYLEKNHQAHFGSSTEKRFHLTSGQKGKVRGDIFEMLTRAILWNASALFAGQYTGTIDKSIKALARNVPEAKYAVISLGDNYDLKKLFHPKAADEMAMFQNYLEKRGTSFCYSTPDVIVIKCPDDVWDYFSSPITSLSATEQSRLSEARSYVEGTISPEDVILAAGVKTSIRSDRMYQLLFEANAWKAIWRNIYSLPPSKYYSLIGQSYGADPIKLNSVEFTSLSSELGCERAIDGMVQFSSPNELVEWYSKALI